MVSRPEVLWRAQVRGEFIEIGGFGSAQGCSDLVVFGPRQVVPILFACLNSWAFFRMEAVRSDVRKGRFWDRFMILEGIVCDIVIVAPLVGLSQLFENNYGNNRCLQE